MPGNPVNTLYNTIGRVVDIGYTLSNLGGSVMGLFGSNDDWKKQAQYNAALNYQYSLKSAKEMPSATRQGLESAGYNPMLALGNVGGSAPIGNVTGATTSYDANSKINNALKLSEIMNNVKAVKSQADLNNQQIKNLDVDAYGKSIENFWKPTMLEAQVNATNSQSDLNKALTIFKNLEIGVFKELTGAQISKLKAEAFSLIKNAITNENVGNSTAWFNYNRSLGKTTGGSIHGLGFGGSYNQTR